MCLALYVASNREMGASEWRDGESVFCVTALLEREQVVRDKFGKSFVMHLGAHTRCSCGFSSGLTTAETPEEKLEDDRGRESIRALRSFLEQELAVVEELDLYACWDGDQGL